MRFSRTTLGLLVMALAGRAAALPNLRPELLDVAVHDNRTLDPGDVIEGCAVAQTGRRLIDFSLRTRNVGVDDLHLGNPGCPDCTLNPGAACANPLFVCSTAHGHPHFNGFVDIEVLDANQQVVAQGHKQGFCLLDLECAAPKYTCGDQGISAGCSDVYVAGLPCQYVDITDVNLPDGDYTLRVHLDPDNHIPESDETDNSASAIVRIGPAPPPPTPTCPVYVPSDVPQTIPDLGSATSHVTVPATVGGGVSRVRLVDLHGTHTYVSDLRAHLVSPLGTDVVVMDRVCGPADDYRLDLADGAAANLACPPTDGGLYAPSHPMQPFVGQSPVGQWTLRMDDVAPQDSGTLDGWGLEVCTTCGNGRLDAGETCDDGNTEDGDCCSADCRTAQPNGAACADELSCVVGGTCNAGRCDGAIACDTCLSCAPGNGCVPPSGVLCGSVPPRRSTFTMRKGVDARHDTLAFDWTSSLPIALLDFGNPPAGTDVTTCVFDASGLKLSATAPGGGTCGLRSCWTPSTTAFRYADRDRTPDGIERMLLKAGAAGNGRITVRGKGADLDMPGLGLQTPVTVRVKRPGTPCWQAVYGSPTRNTPTEFRARSSQ